MNLMEDLERKLDQLLKAPDNPEVFNEIGVLLYQMNDWQNAELYLRRALELDGRNQDILYNYAVLLYLQGQWNRTAEICEAYLELKSDDREMIEKAGASYYQLGKYESAARMYQKLLPDAEELSL